MRVAQAGRHPKFTVYISRVYFFIFPIGFNLFHLHKQGSSKKLPHLLKKLRMRMAVAVTFLWDDP